MAVTNADRKVTKRGDFGGLSHSPVLANMLLPHGRAVFIDDATGLATNTSDGGANKFAGIAHARVDNLAGANGDADVEYWIIHRFELEGSGFAQTDVGKAVYLPDNGDGLTLTPTGASKVGVITEYVSPSVVEVDIEFAG